jgi:uncharacterized protein
VTHYLELEPDRLDWAPLILLVPGIHNSGPEHWQSRWEAQRGDCRRAELGMWDDPHRNTWVNQLNLAIHHAGRPVLLVAHSLGCLAVVWWAEMEKPDVGRPGVDPRLARFALPGEPRRLPFPSILVASEDDPYCDLGAAHSLAEALGSRIENVGAVGHINAASGLGDWPRGQRLLAELLRDHRSQRRLAFRAPETEAQRSMPLAAAFHRYHLRKRGWIPQP